MTDFRENVLDILENWGFYGDTLECGQPALNSGHVQLKCYINNVCPFYKTPYKEDSIIFNDETFEELKDSMPDRVVRSLATTPGVEGVHLAPRKVFRHNYMSKYDPDTDSSAFDPNASLSKRLNDFSTYFKDISANNGPAVVGANQTLYKAEYDWYMIRSVFDKKKCSGDSVEECNARPQWAYDRASLQINRMEEEDIKHDYSPTYFAEYKNSMTKDDDGRPILKSGEYPRLDQFNIQMPVQANIYDENARGIHWKVAKRMPIFKGADFFIRFYKRANEPVKYLLSGVEGIPVEFNNDRYRPLDYTWDDKEVEVTVDPSVDADFKMYANDAVRSTSTPKKLNIYDFYTQAYYIIEMRGKVSRDETEEYYIVIPARGHPIFVHFFKGDNATGVIAKKLGDPFKGISGEQLINADYFDIVVRNHLGRLVIQFEGKGFNNVPPWIVERTDWVAQKVKEGETTYMTEEPRDLVVPKCQLKIWGGNITCGFLFGYLQYEEGHMSFIYPPKDTDISVDSNDKAFEVIEAKKNTSDISEYFKSGLIWLPMNRGLFSAHKLLFEANSGSQLLGGYIGNQGPDPDLLGTRPLFTQDAQYYKSFDEESSTEWELGYFHYNKPIREFSVGMPNGNSPKTSNIIIQKYTYLDYDRTKHQGFDTYVGMMCGDHYFNNIFKLDINPIVDSSSSTGDFVGLPLETDGWFLRNCKTPILTSVRLIAEPSEDPRWDDGTSISGGVYRDPEEGISPYFLDASDHVMSFSHSWTSSGLASLEHSGTIQFYLNNNMSIENLDGRAINNVTNELLALQDKTFYIEIWAGYKDLGCNYGNYTRIPGFYKMFTGMCPGGSISYEYNKHIMTCRINDYSVVLKNMLFFNSPWFDAMKDGVAIREILRMAGFRDQGAYDPATLINGIADDSVDGEEQQFYNHFDGRVFKYVSFGLPSGYNRLEQPALKFNDGDPFIDAINKISSYTAKIFYFDEFGMAHYEDFQDMVEEDFQNEVELVPLYEFTTNPEIIPGQLVFNKVERSFDVDSVVSHLKTLTNTPDMHMLIRDRLKWEAIENPDASGFLGYQKTFFQAESMFGSKEAQISAMNKYAVMFNPIVGVKFETYGVPLRATDIVSIEGEIVRVIKVDHNFNAEKNEWWMNVDCQRFQAINPADLIKEEL